MGKKIICTLAAVDVTENVDEGSGLYVKTDKRNLFCPLMVSSIKEFNVVVGKFLKDIEGEEN